MTLSRQLGLLILVSVVAMSSGGLIIGMSQFRSVSAQALTVDAQALADVIALEVAQQPLSSNHTDTIVMAYLDRGVLQSVKIMDRFDVVLSEKGVPNASISVPDWFQSWMNLPIASLSADIAFREQSMGSVIVMPDPTPTYQTLWQVFLSLRVALLVMMLLAGCGALMCLRKVLKPIKDMEQQAIAVTQQCFTVQNKIPRTRELATLMKAMNHMSSEMKSVFNSHSQIIDQLYDLAHKDKVTGWLRRDPFLLKASDLLASGEACPGVFIVIHLGDLQSLNRNMGYEKVNEWIVSTVVGIMDIIQEAELSVCGRVRGAELALMAVGLRLDEVSLRIRTLLHTLTQQAADQVQPIAAVIQIEKAPEMSQLLSVVDEMLAYGATSSQPLQQRILGEEAELKGRQTWREILQLTFKLDQPNTLLVPVKWSGPQGNPYSRMWLECLDDYDEPVNAKMVEALCREDGQGLKHSLVLLKAAKAKLDNSNIGSVCIPVALQDLINGGALVAELKPLISNSTYASRLVLEFTEFDVLRHRDSVETIVESWISQGIGIGMSQVSGYLPSECWMNWGLTYIVLDASWCFSVDDDYHQLIALEQFVKSARERGILVWGEWCESYDVQHALGDWVDGWLMAPEHQISAPQVASRVAS